MISVCSDGGICRSAALDSDAAPQRFIVWQEYRHEPEEVGSHSRQRDDAQGLMWDVKKTP